MSYKKMYHKSIQNQNKKKRHQHNSLMTCNLDGANYRNRQGGQSPTKSLNGTK